MKNIFIALQLLTFMVSSFAQSKEAGTDREAIKQYVNNKDTMPAFPQNKNIEAVKNVLKQYNSAVEKLDVTGTEKWFSADSKMYESGGSEGSYAHYLEHHLAPELKEFKSFTYSNYKVEVQVEGSYAFTTETYNYSIVLLKDNSEVKRKGIATSVLKKIKGEWKIMISHNSSRK
ncbi:nuclear transport factor 2 family protein [Parasediminibacterium paludis]|uniref:Nuclear transport factor 2 family protein n=1 Tax=Parasediminibacterium paludis TaxID=908966 RepID=A0ABV8Q318_9BACT